MRLLSWNVNGLRAVHRKGDWGTLWKKEKFDILCLQETKAEEEQLVDELKNMANFKSYFASSQIKKGYSGVAIYTKSEPESVEFGIGIKRFDDEGRVITAHYKEFTLLNIYFPNGGGGAERLRYKFDFYDAFLEHVETLRLKGCAIIFCGDVNTAHEEIDLARPKENENNTGFLPEERAWIDEVVAHGYADTFRLLNPTKKDSYSYWDMKTRARERNVGWRIDYFFIDQSLRSSLKKADILSHIYGSDHCPVSIEIKRP
jgi:exodeoxyribonuclease III